MPSSVNQLVPREVERRLHSRKQWLLEKHERNVYLSSLSPVGACTPYRPKAHERVV